MLAYVCGWSIVMSVMALLFMDIHEFLYDGESNSIMEGEQGEDGINGGQTNLTSPSLPSRPGSLTNTSLVESLVGILIVGYAMALANFLLLVFSIYLQRVKR